MILTLTPNPSLDRTLEVERLERGAVLRSAAARVDPGGKGINVARALVAAGVDAVAVLPVGGPSGHHLVDLLGAHGIPTRTTTIAGHVRANVSLVEPDGTTTKVNEPGPVLTAAEVTELLACTARTATAGGARWVASCGSLPDGAPVDLHAQVVRLARAAGARVAVDTSGAPLLAALAERPDLVKPNVEELAEAAGMAIATLGDAVAAAEKLRGMGVGTVLASLGADGAVLVTDHGVLHATAPVAHPVSTVGAGDATLAGYLSAGPEPVSALRLAVAYGAAAVQLPGSAMPGRSDVSPADVRVTDDPVLDLPLGEVIDTLDAGPLLR